MITLRITPHDPLVARDGRPFNAEGGNRVYTLPWPYPSVVAGTVRTLLGKALAPPGPRPFEDRGILDRLKAVAVHGPLLLDQRQLYAPAPRDLVVFDQDGKRRLAPLRPKPLRSGAGDGCDMPHDQLWPIHVEIDEKPSPSPAFWSLERLAAWLAADPPDDTFPVPGCEGVRGFAGNLPIDRRISVRIDPLTLRAADAHLFSTQGLAFGGEQAMAVRVQTTDEEMRRFFKGLHVMHPLGGERRVALFETDAEQDWRPPSAISAALRSARGVRMVLITPAIFRNGWLPGWLDAATLTGSPPGAADVSLRLLGACIDRWRPVSGWSLEHRGPKAVRRVVPAGSVYFFERLGGDATRLASEAWLQSVCDDPQDRRDGFGLAAWGVWALDAARLGG